MSVQYWLEHLVLIYWKHQKDYDHLFSTKCAIYENKLDEIYSSEQKRRSKQQKPMLVLPLNKGRSKVHLKARGQRWRRPCQYHSCEEDCAGAQERLSDVLLISYAEYRRLFHTEKNLDQLYWHCCFFPPSTWEDLEIRHVLRALQVVETTSF